MSLQPETVVRWVRATGDPQKPASCKDEPYRTKNDALAAIRGVKVSSITRIKRMYVVVLQK